MVEANWKPMRDGTFDEETRDKLLRNIEIAKQYLENNVSMIPQVDGSEASVKQIEDVAALHTATENFNSWFRKGGPKM